MSFQNVLQTLRTAKRCPLHPSLSSLTSIQKIAHLVISATRKNNPSSSDQPHSAVAAAEDTEQIISILPDLTPDNVLSILSDRRLNPTNCLDFFKFLQSNESSVSFNLDLQTHLALLIRLLKEKRLFSEVETILASITGADGNLRYSFSEIASSAELHFHDTAKIAARFFNLLFNVYIDNGLFDVALEVFNYMIKNGIQVDEKRCSWYLRSLVRYDKIGTCLEFFHKLVESGLEVSTFSLTIVVSGLCKSGEIKIARELVEDMIEKGIKPNIVTSNILINACAMRWQFEELDSVIALMEKEGVVFNSDTYKTLIDGYLGSRRIEEAERILKEMQDKGFEVDAHLYNMIISRYCKIGYIGHALSVFDKMPEKDVKANADTYCILISGLCEIGQMERVKELLHEMQNKGIDLDEVTFSLMIHKYCDQGMIGEALGLHILMQKKDIMIDVSACGKIASGLCRLGRVNDARTMLTVMAKMGITTPVPSSFEPLLKAMGLLGNLNSSDDEPPIEPSVPDDDPHSDEVQNLQATSLKSKNVLEY